MWVWFYVEPTRRGELSRSTPDHLVIWSYGDVVIWWWCKEGSLTMNQQEGGSCLVGHLIIIREMILRRMKMRNSHWGWGWWEKSSKFLIYEEKAKIATFAHWSGQHWDPKSFSQRAHLQVFIIKSSSSSSHHRNFHHGQYKSSTWCSALL